MMTFRVLIFLVAGLLAPVAAAAAERIDAAYELTWSGFEIGRFETWLTAGGPDYRLAYAARTTGLLGWLFPFTSAGASKGSLANAGPEPVLSARSSGSTWRRRSTRSAIRSPRFCRKRPTPLRSRSERPGPPRPGPGWRG
jgi:hypothetical protein